MTQFMRGCICPQRQIISRKSFYNTHISCRTSYFIYITVHADLVLETLAHVIGTASTMLASKHQTARFAAVQRAGAHVRPVARGVRHQCRVASPEAPSTISLSEKQLLALKRDGCVLTAFRCFENNSSPVNITDQAPLGLLQFCADQGSVQRARASRRG